MANKAAEKLYAALYHAYSHLVAASIDIAVGTPKQTAMATLKFGIKAALAAMTEYERRK